ncbi:MAG: SO_0444 family Cu/Zn efflux transporter [Proteobacteria bacterium]|nr:SO_0444 family Cu/Zn efflux transporter [Pseudomonadota bacterium]
MHVITGVLYESMSLLYQMAPYLLFGFFFAGILHAFISLEWIARHLGKSGIGSVVKSVVLGIPLPLCSCGVIPAAMMLNKKGASRGSVVSFLIATPITGVDSILATYSLMGLFFTVFRVISSAVTAIVAGIMGNLFLATRHEPLAQGPDLSKEGERCRVCGHEGHEINERARCEKPQWWRMGRIYEMIRYAFGELLADIWRWLVVGLLIGGIISYAVPDELITRYLGSPFLSMIVMLLVGIPMYVCSTGSLPIAAALMLKGMSPGAAMVFLLAGPATNAVTITVVAKELGRGAASIYVATIAVMSVAFGFALNWLWYGAGMSAQVVHHVGFALPAWAEKVSAVLFLALVLNVAVRGIIKSSKVKGER